MGPILGRFLAPTPISIANSPSPAALCYDQSLISHSQAKRMIFFLVFIRSSKPRSSRVSHVKILYKSRCVLLTHSNQIYARLGHQQAYVRSWVINIVVRKWLHGSHLSHSLISRTTFLINLNLDQPVISCWLPKKNLISWHNLLDLIDFSNNCP